MVTRSVWKSVPVASRYCSQAAKRLPLRPRKPRLGPHARLELVADIHKSRGHAVSIPLLQQRGKGEIARTNAVAGSGANMCPPPASL